MTGVARARWSNGRFELAMGHDRKSRSLGGPRDDRRGPRDDRRKARFLGVPRNDRGGGPRDDMG